MQSYLAFRRAGSGSVITLDLTIFSAIREFPPGVSYTEGRRLGRRSREEFNRWSLEATREESRDFIEQVGR